VPAGTSTASWRSRDLRYVSAFMGSSQTSHCLSSVESIGVWDAKHNSGARKISAEHIHFRNRQCPNQVTGCLPEWVSATAALPQIAADLLQHDISAAQGQQLPLF